MLTTFKAIGSCILDCWHFSINRFKKIDYWLSINRKKISITIRLINRSHTLLRASWGDWLVFPLGHSGDFPVSDFTDLRTSITTGYNHKISMNMDEYFPKICNRPGDWSVLGSGTWGRQQNLLSGVSLINVTLPSSNVRSLAPLLNVLINHEQRPR